jgi:hypothetical protein
MYEATKKDNLKLGGLGE